ncbi:MAG: hypothetical protein N2749_00710 [Clostridia bacterium]|nr:hypothetical protein [Clostridia bacterium]
MLCVDKIKIDDQYGVDFLEISFTLKDSTEDITEYQFNILRSNNSDDEYFVIATDIKDFVYKDNSVNLYNTMIKYYYKIEIINKVTGEKILSDPKIYTGREPDQYAEALIEINNIYLDNVIDNEEVYLLKRKRTGKLCDCYDDVRGRSRIINCPNCYGTKYVGGYYKPQKLKVAYYNSVGKLPRFEINDTGESDSSIQLWTSNYPVIQNDDIIIDRNNNRYIINNWQPTYKNFYLVKQVFQMQKLPKSNIIYKFPVEIK